MNRKTRQRYTAESKAQAVDLISTGKPDSKIADELLCLRRENAQLKVENDILKKAAIILGSRPQPTSMQSSDQDIGVEIETIFKHHRCRYGYRRIKEQLANHMRTELVSTALKQAIGSAAYRQILSHAGIRQSMSARANPYHNAWTESFMGTLKSNMLQDGCFLNEADARTEILNTSIPITTTTGNISHSATAPQPNSRPKSTLLIKQ